MTRISLITALAVGLACVPACTRDNAPATTQAPQVNATDENFVQEMAQGGNLEVALGQLAESRAVDPRVKEFGQRMASDHGSTGAELKSLAAQKQISVETALNDDNRDKEQDLSAKSGIEFDKAYVSQMIDAHEDTVSRLEKEANDGSDLELKAFAQKVLPTVQEHLRMARELDARLSASR